MPTENRRWLWIVLVIAASVGLSVTLTCATPFAALATLTALYMTRRDALVVTGLSWLAGQGLGFGLLGYPHDVSTYTWGIALGIAGFVTLGATSAIAARLRGVSEIGVTVTAFAGAFLVYQVAVFAAAMVLPSDPSDFAPAVVLDILRVNAISLAGLWILHRLCAGIGLVARRPIPSAAA